MKEILKQCLILTLILSYEVSASNHSMEDFRVDTSVVNNYEQLAHDDNYHIGSYNTQYCFDIQNIGHPPFNKIDSFELIIDEHLIYTIEWRKIIGFQKVIFSSLPITQSQKIIKIGYQVLTSQILLRPPTDCHSNHYVKRNIEQDCYGQFVDSMVQKSSRDDVFFRLWQEYTEFEVPVSNSQGCQLYGLTLSFATNNDNKIIHNLNCLYRQD